MTRTMFPLLRGHPMVPSLTPDAEGHNTMLALPATDGSLCRACHGNGP